MGRRLRRFLLAITRPFPPLHRWLKRYFIEHEEYEFIFEYACDGKLYGFYDSQTGIIALHPANIYKNRGEPEAFDYVCCAIEHETLHRAFHKLGVLREFADWYAKRYGGVPFLETLRKAEEWIVRVVQLNTFPHIISREGRNLIPPFLRPMIPDYPTDALIDDKDWLADILDRWVASVKNVLEKVS